MNNQEFRDFLKIIQKIERCPICGKKYKKSQIFVSGLKQNTMVIEFECCKPLQALVTLSKKPKFKIDDLFEEKWKH